MKHELEGRSWEEENAWGEKSVSWFLSRAPLKTCVLLHPEPATQAKFELIGKSYLKFCEPLFTKKYIVVFD